MLIQIIAQGNNAAGKTTVLAVLQQALLEKGFTDVKFVTPEQTEEMLADKIKMLDDPNHPVFQSRIELMEKYGTIER